MKLLFLAGKSVTINAFSRFSLGTPERRSGGISVIVSPSSLEEASSARLFSALIPFSRAIVPNIDVLCSPPRAIAASDSEPLLQRSYVSGPRDCALQTAAQLAATRGLHNLSIASRMNVFARCIEDQFTH